MSGPFFSGAKMAENPDEKIYLPPIKSWKEIAEEISGSWDGLPPAIDLDFEPIDLDMLPELADVTE